MQNSALSFSVVLDQDKIDINALLEEFQSTYKIKYQEGLELVTIRHYDTPTLERVLKGKNLLIEQKTDNTVRILMKNIN